MTNSEEMIGLHWMVPAFSIYGMDDVSSDLNLARLLHCMKVRFSKIHLTAGGIPGGSHPHIPESFLARSGDASFRNFSRSAREIRHEEMGIKGEQTAREVRIDRRDVPRDVSDLALVHGPFLRFGASFCTDQLHGSSDFP